MSRPEGAPPEAPFDEPWQAQAFALAIELNAQGAFSWSEWSAALSEAIAADPGAPYYESWLKALEDLTARKQLTVGRELADRKQAWARAYETTPHGHPVNLS